MTNEVTMSGGYKGNISATANICPRAGDLLGVFVASTTSGTLALYDSASTGTGTQILATTTFANIGWYALPVSFSTGLYAVIGAALNVTFIFA